MIRTEQRVAFSETGDARHPWEATVDGERWLVRINEFPEEPSLYSLLIGGEVVEELLEWPAAWIRPTARSEDDPHERAELEREELRLERSRGVTPSKRVK